MNFIKKLVPQSIKQAVKNILAMSTTHHEDTPERSSQIEQAVYEEIDRLLGYSRLKLQRNEVSTKPTEQYSTMPMFQNFLNRYKSLRDNDEQELLKQLEIDHPVLVSISDKLLSYFKICDQLKGPMSSVLRRLAYFAIPFMNSANAVAIYSYKETLPRVGLMMMTNKEPRQFLVDALEGTCVIEEVDMQSLIDSAWDRPYEYLEAINMVVEDTWNQLPEEFRKNFSGKEWFIEQISYHIQAQLCLKKLLAAKHWDVLIIGSHEMPLCMTLLDTPSELRPPVLTLYHGLNFGDPHADLLLKSDHIFVRGATEQEFYNDAGVANSNITRVGSLSKEQFPDFEIVCKQRENARLICQVEDMRPIIVYAATYDICFGNQLSPDEILRRLLESFKLLVQKTNGKNPVLYVKYHPAPNHDPYFSFSRAQFPLEKFLQLEKDGYSVRLASNYDQCLPAADCFIAHESTTLTEAVYAGVPTLSLSFNRAKAKPLMGTEAYALPIRHKLLDIQESADTISDALLQLLNTDKKAAYENCARVWRQIYDCGRTAGLVRVEQTVMSMIQAAQSKNKDLTKCSL